MPTFLGRRYARKLDAVGRVEKTVGVLILLAVLGVVALYVGQVATNRDRLFAADETDYSAQKSGTPAAGATRGDGPSGPKATGGDAQEAQDVFSGTAPAGWQTPRQTERFAADTLYEKIDGQADAYIAQGVTGLRFGTYASASDAEHTIDVYVYDVGAAKNAEAAYSAEAPPNPPAVTVGRAAYQAEGAVYFWKGASYVQVLPSRPDDAAAALAIAQHLAERIKE